MKNKIAIYFLFLFCVCINNISHAGNVSITNHATLTLLPGSYQQGKGQALLNINLKPGWYTYWREPGENGFPMRINWRKSQNIVDIELLWPFPHRDRQHLKDDIFMESYIYKKNVSFPLNITAQDTSKPIYLNADISYAICKEVCIPANVVLQIKIDPGENNLENIKLIQQAMQLIPKEDGYNGLKITEIYKHIGNDNVTLQITASANENFNNNTNIFIETDSNLFFKNPHININGNTASFNIASKYYGNSSTNLKLTIVDGNRSIEKSYNIKDIPERVIQVKTQESNKLILMLLFAFAGGLILNIMPCVLPILSIKLLSILKHSGSTKSEIRKSFLVTILGIFVSFLIFAILTIWLKSLGQVVGWGLHFQEPYFIIILTIILTFFAANMWGAYEINLPSIFANIGIRKKGAYADFMSGILATILATPCTAPFLGTAVGFAVTRGTLEIFSVFSAMAVGFAMPYICLGIFPALVGYLPKPGVWMLFVRKLMGLLLALSATWLLWVLAQQIGYIAAFILSALCVGIIILLVTRNIYPIILLIIFALLIPVKFTTHSTPDRDIVWQEFQLSEVYKMVEQGRVVFVDVTASWCLTCKFNKFMVLDTDIIKKTISENQVIAMRADWTNRNTEITQYLHSHARVGIPFNIIYGPNAKNGIILSELLSEEEVIEAIKRAAGDR